MEIEEEALEVRVVGYDGGLKLVRNWLVQFVIAKKFRLFSCVVVDSVVGGFGSG